MKKEDVLAQLQIVNFKEFPGHDGIPGFNLDLKYNGRKIARVYDDSYGGGYQISVIGEIVRNKDGKYVGSPMREENTALLKELNDQVKQLPRDEKYDLEMHLEYLIDELINLKNIEKDAKKGIVCKTNLGHEVYGFKVQLPTMIAKFGDRGLKAIQDCYDELKDKGREILNKEYLSKIGVNV